MKRHYVSGFMLGLMAMSSATAGPWHNASSPAGHARGILRAVGGGPEEESLIPGLTHTLTISASKGGRVMVPGEGQFVYWYDEPTAIQAEADAGYHFTHWSGTFWSTANPATVVMDTDHEIVANFELSDPLRRADMGLSLGLIDCHDANEWADQVRDNNVRHPTTSRYDRLHVLRMAGLAWGGDATMWMRNLPDVDPESPRRGQIIHARAKGAFARCTRERVLVRFSYLFERPASRLQLVAYLSDVPALLEPGALLRQRHYVEIGRVPVPPPDRPGALGSGRLAVFEAWVSTAGLDLSGGTWVELELMEIAGRAAATAREGDIAVASLDGTGGSAYVDDWTVEVHCDGICLDLNWSDTADEEDFLLVVASAGHTTGVLEGGVGSRYCLDGAFSSDGYVDAHDLASWDWALQDVSRVACNLCRVPLPLADSGATVGALAAPDARVQMTAAHPVPGELLVLGKSRAGQVFSDVLRDCFSALDDAGRYVASYTMPGLPTRCNLRVVRDQAGRLYTLNAERGLLQIEGYVKEVVPAGRVRCTREPRYQGEATVYVGIQGQGPESFGRPILDAAFDSQGGIYVVPVVVQPDGGDTYVAAAKLELRERNVPPYRLVQLYDDPPPAGDNQRCEHLREIEVDAAGNVYVLNAHRLNESDILWKYGADGTLRQRASLTGPEMSVRIYDPTALCVAQDGQTLYVAGGQSDPQYPNTAALYRLSLGEGLLVQPIMIGNMYQITGVTENRRTGSLWVTGFGMPEPAAYPSPAGATFYLPVLAEVAPDARTVEAVSITGQALALPTSIVWTGARE